MLSGQFPRWRQLPRRRALRRTEPAAKLEAIRQVRSEGLLAALAPFRRVVVVSHVNPDPDSLASMLGLKALAGVVPEGSQSSSRSRA